MNRKKRQSVFTPYRQASIKIQLLSVAVILTILVCVVILIFYSNITHSERNNSYNEISSYIDEINRNIALKCENYNQLLGMIAFEETVQNFVTTDSSNTSLWIDQTKHLDSFLQNIVNLHPDITDVIIMDQHGNTYGLIRNYREDNPRIQENLLSKDNYHYSEVIDLSTFTRKWSGIIISSRIYSLNPHQLLSDIGAAALIIRPESIGLSEAAQRSTFPVQLFVLDSNGKVFSRGNQIVSDDEVEKILVNTTKDTTITIDGEKYIAYIRDVELMDGTLLALVSEQTLIASTRNIQQLTIWILIVSIVFVCLISWYVLKGIINPIHTLSQTMHRIGSIHLEEDALDQLSEHIDLIGCKEAREMAFEYNRMMHTVKHLTQAIIDKDKHILQTEIEKKQAELSFLQSQINPHFMCNAFDSIKGLAAQHNDPEIRNAANDLSVFFRYSLLPGDKVKLKDELDAVDRYVRIQHLRFGNRFSVSYQVSEACNTLAVPRMILQPLVENAIVHGIETLERNCTLIIGTEIIDGVLTMWVQDNGKGIPTDKLTHIKKKMTGRRFTKGSDTQGYHAGIGIINVNNRIQLNYGEAFGLHISSCPGEGTSVTIRMPAESYRDVPVQPDTEGGENNVSHFDC